MWMYESTTNILVIAIFAYASILTFALCLFKTRKPDGMKVIEDNGANVRLKKLKNKMAYDKTTKVVYICDAKKNILNPYIAKNGKPYTYNKKTKQIETGEPEAIPAPSAEQAAPKKAKTA